MGLQIVEAHPLFLYFLEKCLAILFSFTNKFFLLLVIREYGSTLYVGLARAISPTNTNFWLTFLLTRLQEALYEDLAVQSIKFEVYTITFLAFYLILIGSQFLAPVKKFQFLRFVYNNNYHNHQLLQTGFLRVILKRALRDLYH